MDSFEAQATAAGLQEEQGVFEEELLVQGQYPVLDGRGVKDWRQQAMAIQAPQRGGFFRVEDQPVRGFGKAWRQGPAEGGVEAEAGGQRVAAGIVQVKLHLQARGPQVDRTVPVSG